MKVKELIEELKKQDPEKEVYVPYNDGEHEYYVVHTVRSETLTVLDEDEETIVIDYE